MPGLYIHIPFCRKKCHYCDFHIAVSQRFKPELLKAIHKELLLRKDEIKEDFDTLYFGGGTPTVLKVREWEALMKVIHDNYSFTPGYECTIEANPEDLNKEYINEIKGLGVNRLSIGIQSFSDIHLLSLNRVHTARQALESISYARESGIENISIDLIYGIPGLSDSEWEETMELFNSLQLPHLSAYALTVEKKTALYHMIYKGLYPQVEEEHTSKQYGILIEKMKEFGYKHYEVSNFSLPGCESRHNKSYWEGESYLGIGPSAHSFINDTRSWNIANNAIYIKQILNNKLPSKEEKLTPQDKYNEYLMTRLRTTLGVELEVIKHRFGETYLNYLLKNALPYLTTGRLVNIDNVLYIPEKHLFVSDAIISGLFYV